MPFKFYQSKELEFVFFFFGKFMPDAFDVENVSFRFQIGNENREKGKKKINDVQIFSIFLFLFSSFFFFFLTFVLYMKKLVNKHSSFFPQLITVDLLYLDRFEKY